MIVRPKIRQFVKADIPQLIELGRECLTESRFNYLYYDVQRIRDQWLQGVDSPYETAFVIEFGDKIVGMSAVRLIQYDYNYDFYANDYFTYIQPEHRAGLLVIKLFKALQQWAIEKRAVEIRFNYGFGDDNERIAKLMKLLRYEKMNEEYRKMLM